METNSKGGVLSTKQFPSLLADLNQLTIEVRIDKMIRFFLKVRIDDRQP